jgi:hypothetical protein
VSISLPQPGGGLKSTKLTEPAYTATSANGHGGVDIVSSAVGKKPPPLLSGLDGPANVLGLSSREHWLDMLGPALADRSPQSLRIADDAIRALPADPVLLLTAALAALVANQPDRAMTLLKRFEKKFVADRPVTLLTALTLARQGYVARAWTLLNQDRLIEPREAMAWFIGGKPMAGWLVEQLTHIRKEHGRTQRGSAARAVKKAPPRRALALPAAPKPAPKPAVAGGDPLIGLKHFSTSIETPVDLPRLHPALDVTFELVAPESIQISGEASEPRWFDLRAELTQLGLVEGFDELLCLTALRGVEAHWYQIETVRKVLKQYRGRVLLADEVGLGKTIEAGMILKEYLLRGMAERILILVPAPLVGQWREEMVEKFGIDCATTHDALLR